MKPFIIRKGKCGHWVIYEVIDIEYDIVIFNEYPHIDTFSDILLLINGEATLEYV